MSFIPTLTRRAFLRETCLLSPRSLLLPTLSASRIPLPPPHQIRHTSTATPPTSNTTPLPTTILTNPTSTPTSSPSTSLSQSLPDLTNIKTLHTALRHQPPYYTTIHIHSYPYLVTLGDKVTLPALLYGPPSPTNPLNKPLQPGDVIRLTHASTLGSRDFTMKGAPFIDERLFTCKAVVLEVTSEPMRKKEKTKRRQRRVKTVTSKHRYTVLSICQLDVHDLPEGLEGEVKAAEEKEVKAAEKRAKRAEKKAVKEVA
ncbi:hypothetical protein TWF694_008318 [Orbilia ellipsospora]|uniref:Large ribosomal subunit protein bL21m n=1 Tax=Orbilia ellipsospora TaxID=2528407 RepID=A0AAV9XFQ5_9PEZI